MMKSVVTLLLAGLFAWIAPFLAADEESVPVERGTAAPAAPAAVGGEAFKFYVIPIEGPISEPTLYAVRNGVKDAIEGDYDVILLDMETPGGRLDSTLKILETLDRFPRKKVTFVREATSAGAIIASVTQEIYFAPRGTMGSAEVVTGDGEDVNESMKRKITSFLNSKLDSYTGEYPFRSDVIRAMMDPDFEFKIGEEIISPKGELLNLNAEAAMKEYGDPPQPILASGIVADTDKLMESLALGKERQVTRFTPTWSLKLAQYIVLLAPALLAIAMITVYMELQTPGFGVFGTIGVVCFLVAIFGHNVAGLSGHEPLLLFLVGVLFLALEIFLAPGTLLFAIPGMLLILGSLVWSMADIWPKKTPDFSWEWSTFEKPLQNLMLGGVLGVVIILVVARFLPKSLIWNRLVLATEIRGTTKGLDVDAEFGGEGPVASPSLVGAEGVALTPLNPTGEIDVGGRRIEAKLIYGSAPRGARVRVVSRGDFGYVVEEVQS